MGNISRKNIIHITDRAVHGSDVGTATWDDRGVIAGSSYSYTIDSYDASGNRSQLSSVQSITAGDVTPPGPITNTAVVSGYKSIEYKWRNPSDTDFEGIYIYEDAALTTMRHELGGLVPLSYMSKTINTSTSGETLSLYFTTFDKNRNENTSYVKITGVSQVPPQSTAGSTETMTISIKDELGREYQTEAYLMNRVGGAPLPHNWYRIHVRSSTPVSWGGATEGIFWYGGDLATVQSFLSPSIVTFGSFYEYRSTDMNVAAAAEGSGFVKAKGSDSNGAPLSASMTVFVDLTAPVASNIKVDNNSTATNSRGIDVKFTYSDTNGSGVDSYQISTANSLSQTDWHQINKPNYSPFAGTAAARYILPDVEKQYTIYLWLRDKAGNISAVATSQQPINYHKLRHAPVGSFSYFNGAGTQAISPNDNNWFNQSVRVRFTAKVPEGSPSLVQSIKYRSNVGGVGWSSWSSVAVGPASEIAVNTVLGADDTYLLQYYAMNDRYEPGGSQQTEIRIDSTDPGMVKASFWNTTKSKSVNRSSLLFWNKSAGSDGTPAPSLSSSGLDEVYIYRASTDSWSDAHTIAAFNYKQEWMIDDDDFIQSGSSYSYWGRFSDKADNLSGTSNPISIAATYDWEYAYRNWISNGSFERVNATLGTVNDWLSGPYTMSDTAKFGIKSVRINPAGGGTLMYQTVHIPADDRDFTLSFYLQRANGAFSGQEQCRVITYAPNGDQLYSTIIPLTDPVSGWQRSQYNFGRSLTNTSWGASAAYALVGFRSISGKHYCIDGVQWEEGIGATDYVDVQGINAQRINAGVIDANHIRSLSIVTTLLDAEAVTAAKIKANTITANEIAANTIVSSVIAANAIVSSVIAARVIESGHIATEGLHVKSGANGVPLITVGDSSDPTNQSYHVISTADIYYHPRGFSASERWHYLKHMEYSHAINPGEWTNFKRRFIAPDGSPFTPDHMAHHCGFHLDTLHTFGLADQWVFTYATASQIIAHVARRWDTAAVGFQRIDDNLAQSISVGGSYIYDITTDPPGTWDHSHAPFVWIEIAVPWSGPVDTMQRVRYRIECSTNSANWVGTCEYRRFYAGESTSVTYRETPFNTYYLNAPGTGETKYFRVTYVDRTNGPSTITWDRFQFHPNLGDPTWIIDSTADGMFPSYTAWDGFLGY